MNRQDKDSLLHRARRAHMSTRAPAGMKWKEPEHTGRIQTRWHILAPALGLSVAAVLVLLVYVRLRPVEEPSQPHPVVQNQKRAVLPSGPQVAKSGRVMHPRNAMRRGSSGKSASGHVVDTHNQSVKSASAHVTHEQYSVLEPGVEVVRQSADLLRRGKLTYVLKKGEVTFHVSKEGRGLVVEAAGASVHITGTVFTLSVHGSRGALEVLEGRVKLVTPAEAVRYVSKSESVSWSSVPSEREIRAKLAAFRRSSHHAAAVSYLTRMLHKVPRSPLKASLYIEMASIQGVMLQEWDEACVTLDSFRREFGTSAAVEPAAKELRERFRCH